MRRPQLRHWVLLALVALVFVRLGLAYSLRSSFFTSGDQSYDDIATNITAGHWFEVGGRPYVANPPVYALLVAGAYEVGGRGWLSVAILQVVFELASAVLLFVLGERLVGRRAALVAVVVYALYPYLAGQAALIMDTTVFTTLLLAFLVAVVSYAQVDKRRFAIAAGIAAGAAFQVRPTVAMVCVLLPLLLAILGASRRRVAIGSTLALVAGLLTIAPWTIRNAVEFHAFVPAAAKGGINYWKGNSPYAASYISSGKSVDLLPERPGAPRPPQGLDPVEEDSWWLHQAFDWNRSHPRAWIHVSWIKLVAFWTPELNPRTAGDSRLKRAVYAVSYGPVAILASIGAIVLWRRGARRELVFLCAILAAFTAAHVLSVGYSRLRAPVDPLLMIMAGTTVVALTSRIQRPQR